MEFSTKGRILVLLVAIVCICSCSTVKHVPEGEYLLDDVKIRVSDNSGISPGSLMGYLRQRPNHEVLGFAKLQLATYSLSGRDTAKWYNRWLQRLGQPPVIFSPVLTQASASQLHRSLVNRGYMDAHVGIDTIPAGKKRMDVIYTITTGKPHVISSVSYDIPDTVVRNIVMADSSHFLINVGGNLDREVLDMERTAITRRLHNKGYYEFNKEYIVFTADTARGEKDVALTLHIRPPKKSSVTDTVAAQHRHYSYNVRNVIFVTDYNAAAAGNDFDFGRQDTVRYNGITVLYGSDHYIRPSALEEKCFIVPGSTYDSRQLDRPYQALSQMGILNYINIRMRPVTSDDGKKWLDAYILLSRARKQSVAIELEGTNSEGDLGFGIGLTYQHRNLARGSELLSAKLRTSYESLSGNINGLINNRYTEFAGEVSITFPKVKAPFLTRSFKQRMKANTEFSISGNYQERPEYTRIIAGAAWKYRMNRYSGHKLTRHTYDMIDINYVYLPKSTLNFLDSIAPANPLLRYSYEDHFIMRMGYTLYRTNRRTPTATINNFAIQPSIFTLRASVETAGNLLYAISGMFDQRRHDGTYHIFGIQYSQYVKGEFEYTYTRNFNDRNALGLRGAFGIAYPYGNSRMMPFEKRFYAGGANGVRGWGVRTLGPGCYDSKKSMSNFINQCGDISLILSAEYRAKLFWVLEGALFIDAGNIWTVHNYENQPGGMFKFNEFYKQIAMSYGAGLRLDFTYFLLRFDIGLKAYNPARGQESWPLLNPRWHRDATFHFAVGYPF